MWSINSYYHAYNLVMQQYIRNLLMRYCTVGKKKIVSSEIRESKLIFLGCPYIYRVLILIYHNILH